MYKKLLLFHFALLFCFIVLAQKQSTVLITYYLKKQEVLTIQDLTDIDVPNIYLLKNN
jgi:hypothetical protein